MTEAYRNDLVSNIVLSALIFLLATFIGAIIYQQDIEQKSLTDYRELLAKLNQETIESYLEALQILSLLEQSLKAPPQGEEMRKLVKQHANTLGSIYDRTKEKADIAGVQIEYECANTQQLSPWTTKIGFFSGKSCQHDTYMGIPISFDKDKSDEDNSVYKFP